MSRSVTTHRASIFLFGLILGFAVHSGITTQQTVSIAAAEPNSAAKAPDAGALNAELENIKKRLPDQAHAMSDVGDHFTNLFHAGSAENWPLATFYWNETRSHLRWAVGIIPIRKDSAGREVNLASILQALENGPLAQLQKSIEAKDKSQFVGAYRFTLESCYACHKACDKPFLRPQLPTQPASRIMNFQVDADWPK